MRREREQDVQRFVREAAVIAARVLHNKDGIPWDDATRIVGMALVHATAAWIAEHDKEEGDGTER